MKKLALVALLISGCLALADVVGDVRSALDAGNLPAAEVALNSYRAQHGTDSSYLEALSWMARGALAAKQLDQAQKYAGETESLVKQELQHHKLDSDPHLPVALGAAIEVESRVFAAHGENAKAIALLRRSIVTYGSTSIRARLQKNLNELSLTGQPAPTLSEAQYLGIRPTPLTQLKGSPVLLFFWAHWCGDCKYEGPIISRLSSELGSKLAVLAPTQLYGYAAYGADAKPSDELAYIGKVWRQYYPGLQSVPVPISKANFNNYGASTTPTLVLIDGKGRVALYHPGLMQYDDLRMAIERTIH